MATKKKRGGRPAPTGRAKAKAGAKPKTKAKASAKAKAKAGAKAKASAKAKTGAKAKASAKKAKTAPTRKRPSASVAKAKPHKSAPAKKRTPRAAEPAAAKPATEPRSGPVILDEVIEESLLDVSAILRVKDGVARSKRDVDEDELQQFPDPSLVVEVETRDLRRADDSDESETSLPDLFAAEARRQKERAADLSSGAAEKRREGSLFGTLGAGGSEPDDDGDAASDAGDED